MQHVEFNWRGQSNRNIFAQEWRPDGEIRGAVCLVHGLGEHSSRYQHVAQSFTQAGFALVGCDLPGHGRSEGQRGCTSYDEICPEIDTLLKETGQRYPGAPRFLYGHSMGGALTLYYVLKRSPAIAGAIVTSPALAPGTPVLGWKVTLANLLAGVLPSFTLSNGLDTNNLSRDTSIVQAYLADPLVHDRVSTRLGRDLLTLGDRIIAQAGSFPLPLLLMHGSADHLASPEASTVFAGRAPAEKTTFHVWEGYCHETHNEFGKELVIQMMVDWLMQHV